MPNNSSIEKELSLQWKIDNICDYLEGFEDRHFGLVYYCPMRQKTYPYSSEANCCIKCKYFQRNNLAIPNNKMLIACSFREKDMHLNMINDFRELERDYTGHVTSVYVLRNDTWEHWVGFENSILVKGDVPLKPKVIEIPDSIEGGEPIYKLWKPEYHSLGVKNLVKGTYMLINGRNGKMLQDDKGRIIGKYYNPDRKKKFSGYYVVWDAEKAIWAITKEFFETDLTEE